MLLKFASETFLFQLQRNHQQILCFDKLIYTFSPVTHNNWQWFSNRIEKNKIFVENLKQYRNNHHQNTLTNYMKVSWQMTALLEQAVEFLSLY